MDANDKQKPRQRRPLFWRLVRVTTISVACLATLIALFYTEEDWRGKHAWEQRKKELLAKGEVLDWSALIPPPVPDDKNFFKAPGIAESDWVGRGECDLTRRFSQVSVSSSTNTHIIGTIAIATPFNSTALAFEASNAPVYVCKWI